MLIYELVLPLLAFFSSFPWSPKPALLSGGVTSEVRVCSDIGAQMLAKGGNAADAAIATTLCVGVVASYHSGIGGDGFALIRSGNGARIIEAIDFRAAAPALAKATHYTNDTQTSKFGGLSVAVPSQLRGLQAIYERHAKLPWADLVAPSIKLARDGFQIYGDLWVAMNLTRPGSRGPTNFAPTSPLATTSDSEDEEKLSWLQANPLFREVFAPKGELLPLGSFTTRRTYAEALSIISQQGPSALYEGPIAEEIVASVKAEGGLLSMDDLKNYKARIVQPIAIKYHNHTIFTIPAPSSGSVFLSILNTISGYTPRPKDKKLEAHRLVEAMKFAFGQRTMLGDPAFVKNASRLQEMFITEEQGARFRKMTDDGITHDAEYYNPTGYSIQDDRGTSHIAASDSSGLSVSLTTSINLYWGSRIMTPTTGIVLNDEMDDFSFPNQTDAFGFVPSPSNYVKGGKRPMSSMCPYIVENEKGEFLYAGGSAGGSRIITANAQTVRNLIDYEMTAYEALKAPRIHDQIWPPVTLVEGDSPVMKFKGIPASIVEHLTKVGHNSTIVPVGLSVSNGVKYSIEGGWEAEGDPRKYDTGGAVFLA